MKKSGLLSLVLSLSLFSFNQANACTDFRLQAKDGTVLVTRSMEFALDMHSNIRSSTRGRAFTTTAPDGKTGASWKAKYGYIYLDGLNIDAAIDGMNEVGLSYEALFFPGYAKYQTVPDGQDAKGLPYISFGDWILGNFKTVEEVREALANIYLFEQKIPGMGDQIFPLHFSIYDASGKGIVVETVDGKMAVYDSIGVMTNSPDYTWHTKNLINYLHLAPVNPNNVVANNVIYAATGQGFGMIGLPGDVSPPSRFVKTSELLLVALKANDAVGALNLANHVINNVDIPFGLVREPGGDATNESTEWVVFKDLTNKMFYYRTYDDFTLRSVDLSKLDFRANAVRVKMPIASKQTIADMTSQLLKTKSD
jgi:choloylglycine hydrolase